MRIGVISYELPIPGLKRGGVPRVAHDLADGLARRGHAVTVWSIDPRPPGAAYTVRPLPMREFVESKLGLRLTLGYVGNLIALLPDFRDCDVILTHGDSVLLPLRCKPVVRVVHGSALAEALSARSPWRFAMQLGVYVQELATALTQPGCVAVSENTRRHIPFIRHVIPNGVDLRRFTPSRPDEKSREPMILFVGTLAGRKRGTLLLDWFNRRIRPQVLDARLVMVTAPGPEHPGVSYHHGIGVAELSALYRQAWVYATPSSYEGFGLPYLEAMASGTPIVATPNPGSREVLDGGRYGILAPDHRFAAELIGLLNDPNQRAKLAVRGLQRAESFSLERTLDRYEELLSHVVGWPKRRGA